MESIPFTSFFNSLRKNGFSVTQGQIINAYKIILKYADQVNNEEELCLYLVPIFANSEDEQRLFSEIFEAEFKVSDPLRVRKSIRQQLDLQGKKHPVKLIAIYSLIALLVVCVIVFSYGRYKSIDPGKVGVYLQNTSSDVTSKTGRSFFNIRANHELNVEAFCYYKNLALKNLTLKTKYNWGENENISEYPKHTYAAVGEYYLTAYAEVFYNEKIIRKDTLRRRINVCPDADLSVTVSEKDKIIPAGRTIVLTASVAYANFPGKFYTEWKEGATPLGQKKILRLSFDSSGVHVITCTVYFTGTGFDCPLEKNILLTIGAGNSTISGKESPLINSPATEDITVPAAQNRDKTFLYWLYFILSVIFLGLSIFFFMLYQKTIVVKSGWKSPEANNHLQLVSLPAVKHLSKTIPFKHNNYLIVDHPELHEMAKPLRRRINDHVSFLHIDKTIQKTIHSGGFFQLVKTPRTRPPEYLVLIDEAVSNHGLVKLLEYLLDLLKKQNLVIEKFYFKNKPDYCYSITEPGGISLDKLSARYNKHVLLIFGEADQFISTPQHVFIAAYLEILNHWQYKALLTPVPYPDWSLKESVLASGLPIVPVDLEGLIILSELLLHEKNDSGIVVRLKAKAENFYTTSGIDFEDTDQLEKYCAAVRWANVTENGLPVNILFEWIKALAVYPKVHWEILIAVGKAILDKYKKPDELNFTNLLRIIRIDWVKQGVFPDNIRLDLLKALTKNNEVIARETVLRLLNELPDSDITDNSTAYEEREMQKLVNEFNLYAYNPVAYGQYRDSKKAFENIWKNDLFEDHSMKLYLKNKDELWQTLLEHDSVNGPVSIEKYFEAIEIEETNLSRTYLWLTIISVFVFVSSCFALMILYRWDSAGL